MKCSQCKIVEMQVLEVKDNLILHKCKRCGNEQTQTIEELEKESKEKAVGS